MLGVLTSCEEVKQKLPCPGSFSLTVTACNQWPTDTGGNNVSPPSQEDTNSVMQFVLQTSLWDQVTLQWGHLLALLSPLPSPVSLPLHLLPPSNNHTRILISGYASRWYNLRRGEQNSMSLGNRFFRWNFGGGELTSQTAMGIPFLVVGGVLIVSGVPCHLW